MSQSNAQLAWVVEVSQKQFSTKKNYFVIFVLILFSAILVIVTYKNAYHISLLDAVISARYFLIGIILIPVIIFLFSSAKSNYFVFKIYDWGVTRINGRPDGSISKLMSLILAWETFLAKIFHFTRRDVVIFSTLKGYREENGRFVLEPKSPVNWLEFTVIYKNNREAVKGLLDKFIPR